MCVCFFLQTHSWRISSFYKIVLSVSTCRHQEHNLPSSTHQLASPILELTAVPFRGQTTWNLSDLSPRCGTAVVLNKGVKEDLWHQVSICLLRRATAEYVYQVPGILLFPQYQTTDCIVLWVNVRTTVQNTRIIIFSVWIQFLFFFFHPIFFSQFAQVCHITVFTRYNWHVVCTVVLRGTLVNRACGEHKNLYI